MLGVLPGAQATEHPDEGVLDEVLRTGKVTGQEEGVPDQGRAALAGQGLDVGLLRHDASRSRRHQPRPMAGGIGWGPPPWSRHRCHARGRDRRAGRAAQQGGRGRLCCGKDRRGEACGYVSAGQRLDHVDVRHYHRTRVRHPGRAADGRWGGGPGPPGRARRGGRIPRGRRRRLRQVVGCAAQRCAAQAGPARRGARDGAVRPRGRRAAFAGRGRTGRPGLRRDARQDDPDGAWARPVARCARPRRSPPCRRWPTRSAPGGSRSPTSTRWRGWRRPRATRGRRARPPGDPGEAGPDGRAAVGAGVQSLGRAARGVVRPGSPRTHRRGPAARALPRAVPPAGGGLPQGPARPPVGRGAADGDRRGRAGARRRAHQGSGGRRCTGCARRTRGGRYRGGPRAAHVRPGTPAARRRPGRRRRPRLGHVEPADRSRSSSPPRRSPSSAPRSSVARRHRARAAGERRPSGGRSSLRRSRTARRWPCRSSPACCATARSGGS